MTDEEIIIDGVGVSRCSNYDHGSYFECKESCCHCDEIPNCYFKQLKRKEQELLNQEKIINKLIKERDNFEQECEKLKREIAFGNNGELSDKNKSHSFKDLNDENSNYNQALNEIEKIVSEPCFFFDKTCEECSNNCEQEILDIIHKAKESKR